MKQTPTGISVRAAAAGLALFSLAACGSSHPSSAPKPSPSGGSTSSSPAPSVLTPAATAQIKHAYTTFLGGANKDPQVIPTVLQNADKLTAVIAAQAKNPITAGLSATVSKVTLVNPHLADVTFTLLSKGQPLLSNQVGKAVLVDGTWKVAAYTFCGLASVAGTIPPECKQASVVALPTS